MDKEAARDLVKELTAALEAPEPFPIVPLVRKAARLAALVDARDHRVLFEAHLDGLDHKGHVPRISTIAESKLDTLTSLLTSDRSLGDTGKASSLPLDRIDRDLANMRKALDIRLPADERKNAIQGIRAFEDIEERIRRRVNVFVCDAIRRLNEPSSSVSDQPRLRGTKVFIGHGSSPIWKDLHSFLKDRLHVDCIEFNTESQAGNMTVARLTEMLDESCLAFLVATGEDTHADGTVHARENVIHETGLFQAKLGFKQAIVLLEEGCARFSNIDGVTDVRFPKGNIMAASEEIRRVLERERLLLPAAV